MQAARMSFEEEVIKLRAECKLLRIKNSNVEKKNTVLTSKVEQLKKDYGELKTKYQSLEQDYQQLLTNNQQQVKQIESLNLIVEELRVMVFGKKRKKKMSQNDGSSSNTNNSQDSKERKSANRSKDSYRRSAPKEEEVSETFIHLLASCPDCGTALTTIKQVIRYVEDLPNLEILHQLLKRVEKHIIETGFCPNCGKRKTVFPILPQICTLGESVKKFICYLNIVMRLSLEQISCLLQDTAKLSVSDGEIVTILDEQAKKLTPENERIAQRIRAAPGRHYDESGWRVQKEGLGNYAWITRSTETEDTIFLLGVSRGKGNAEKLRGEVDNQVGITDDYSVYDHLFARHQLCLAHPNRKLRDLAESKVLSGGKIAVCTKAYEAFSELYEDLELTLATEYQKEYWLQKRGEYIRRLKEIVVVTDQDPEKLKKVKRSLNDNSEKYFTCLFQPGIPCDNNKAERGFRHLVLKRKSSYGSKTQKGADTTSILSSTLLSCWWKKPDNFFVAYNQMLAP